jgi:hypothetical protein
MTEKTISLMEVTQKIPSVTRDQLIAAIDAGHIHTESKKAPFLVMLSDVVAWRSHILNRSEFIARFTDAEKIAAASSPQVLIWWLQLMDMPEVDISNATVIANVSALVGAGVIASDRQAVILAPKV